MWCPAIAFVVAAVVTAGCDATLGGGGQTDASTADTRAVDATQFLDAPGPDARPCMGGNAAAVAPDGSCLVHFTAPATYVNARAGCMAIDAHLAYLKSAAVDMFAETFIGTLDTWIGGNDLTTETQFIWDDNTAFAFTNWAAGEPNDGGDTYAEDCVIIAGARLTKQWDDRPCDGTEIPTSGSFAYLCQY